MTRLAHRLSDQQISRFLADPFPVRQTGTRDQNRRSGHRSITRLIACTALAFCVALLWPSIANQD